MVMNTTREHRLKRSLLLTLFDQFGVTTKLLQVKVFGGQVYNFAQTEKINLRKEPQTVSETEEFCLRSLAM
jgi:hypothetical protein